MSYVRFGSDGSQVYVYCDINGYLACCGCRLGDKWDFRSTDEIVAHLREHLAAGHCVPDDVIPALEADREENDEFIADCAAEVAAKTNFQSGEDA